MSEHRYTPGFDGYCNICQEPADYCTGSSAEQETAEETVEPSGSKEKTPRKTTATLLVEIADDLYTFGCVADQRGGSAQNPGSDPVAVHTYACPKNNPEAKRPLADIRDDLAAVFQATFGTVPGRTPLADAMTVLEGRAKQTEPVRDKGLFSALLAAGADSKTSMATRLVEKAEEQYTLGITTGGEPYAVPKDGPYVARMLRGGRHSVRAELAKTFYAETQTAASSSALADAMLVLEGLCQQAEPVDLPLRVARTHDGRLVVDLGTEDGSAVVISPGYWEIVDRSPVLFRRTGLTLPLPTPVGGKNLDDTLRPLLNIADADWPLYLAVLVAALYPTIPHPIAAFVGEHGTAKTWAARIAASLIDPAEPQVRTNPKESEDWIVAASGSWVTVVDNVGRIQPWFSDALCRASTGEGLVRRKLYTDSDTSAISFRRVVMITALALDNLAGDLADRLVRFELERIEEGDRDKDEQVSARLERSRPEILGGLLDLAAQVLENAPDIFLERMPRMADFALIVAAVDRVLGTSAYETYTVQARSLFTDVLESDAVAIALRNTITAEWEGPAGRLLELLTDENTPKDWPRSPQGMGSALTRIAPALRQLGWIVERLPRTDKKGTRRWRIAPPRDTRDAEDQRDAVGTTEVSAASETGSDQGKRADASADVSRRPDDPADDPDDPADDPDHGITAGHGASDNADVSAGTPFTPGVFCLGCGEPMRLIDENQTHHPGCEPGCAGDT